MDGEGKRQREARSTQGVALSVIGSWLSGRREAVEIRSQRSEVSEETSNGERPIAQDPAKAKSGELSVRSRAAQLGLELSPKS